MNVLNFGKVNYSRIRRVFDFFFESLLYDICRDFLIGVIRLGSVAANSCLGRSLTSPTCVMLARKEFLYELILLLQKFTEFQFCTLLDIWAVDLLESTPRFVLSYNLVSYRFNRRLFIYVRLEQLDVIKSISQLFAAAEWLEREIWEFFGIYFLYHSDLRRLFTDYGYEWFPLRKDFPVIGFVEVRYEEGLGRIDWSKGLNIQGFRFFEFGTNWSLMQ